MLPARTWRRWAAEGDGSRDPGNDQSGATPLNGELAYINAGLRDAERVMSLRTALAPSPGAVRLNIVLRDASNFSVTLRLLALLGVAKTVAFSVGFDDAFPEGLGAFALEELYIEGITM